MKRLIAVSVAGLTLLMAAPVLGGVVAVASLFEAGHSGSGAGSPSRRLDQIPGFMLVTYRNAARVCPGLSWSVLAAIGTIESANNQSSLPGVHSGHNAAGAEGPMQFEPSTFRRYDRPVPPGGVSPPSPYDPVDAAYAAARLLCTDGAGHGSRLRLAVYAYNHSDAYVDHVVQLAEALKAHAEGVAVGLSGAVVAVDFAVSQVGTPYRWGGETPGLAFDCSGLVQAAWAAAGVRLPRRAEDQFAAGPLLAPEAALQPGDLVFFGPAAGGVTHVGLVLDPSGRMVDAPHTGASVRVDSFPPTVGAAWGCDLYLGATRPGVQ